MNNLEKAKEILATGYTCVLVKGDEIITSKDRGVAPLMNLINNGQNLTGYALADKIIGKAAALLATYLGITQIYSPTMSSSACQFLDQHSIQYCCDLVTEKIINREKTGTCPMEATVQNIDDIEEGYLALKNKLESLKKLKN